MKYYRKRILFKNKSLEKKNNKRYFDITIKLYDTCKESEIVIIYMSIISNIIEKHNIGLFRDDGLIILNN